MSYTDIIYRGLRKQGGEQRSDSIWICCPFHGENTPSLSIAMTSETVMIGTFFCFGCSKSGNWNVLAEKLGVEKVDLSFLVSEEKSTVKRRKRTDFSELTTKEFLIGLGFISFTKWPSPKETQISFFKEWYSIPGKLLWELEAYLVIEKKKNKHRMFLPVKVHNVIRGGIRVVYKKDGIERTYLNTDGDWVKTHGLFPYDFVHKMIKNNKHKFLILVEGPRDALRLINLGLPAIAILGSQSFTENKALIVSSTSNIDTVYIMPDSDAAGMRMIRLVNRYLKGTINVSAIRLPKEIVDGEEVHTDPHSISLRFLKKVVRTLNRVHGSNIVLP